MDLRLKEILTKINIDNSYHIYFETGKFTNLTFNKEKRIYSINLSLDELAIFWTERECRVKENSINNHINITLFDVFNNKYILSYGFVSNNNIKFYNACI